MALASMTWGTPDNALMNIFRELKLCVGSVYKIPSRERAAARCGATSAHSLLMHIGPKIGRQVSDAAIHLPALLAIT